MGTFTPLSAELLRLHPGLSKVRYLKANLSLFLDVLFQLLVIDSGILPSLHTISLLFLHGGVSFADK